MRKNSAGDVGVTEAADDAVSVLVVVVVADDDASDEEIERREVARVSSTARQCSIARTISPLQPSSTSFSTWKRI